MPIIFNHTTKIKKIIKLIEIIEFARDLKV